jgi:phage baseplate assembly protein V
MDPIAHIVRELEEIKRRMRRMMFHGLVTDVDAEKRLVRVSDGTKDEQGQEVKTNWLPWAELAGGLKTKTLPTKGQQVFVCAPDGLLEKGFVSAGFFTDENKPPDSKDDEYVLTNGKEGDKKIHIAIKDDKITIASGDKTSLTITKDKMTAKVDGSEIEIKPDHVNFVSRNMHHVGNSHLAVEEKDQQAAELMVTQTGFATDPARSFVVKSNTDHSGGWQAAMESGSG